MKSGMAHRKGRRMRYPLISLAAILCLLAAAATSFAAGSNVLSVTATILSKSNCKFNTATSALAFGTLDPGSSSDATASTTVTFSCGGSAPTATFAITHDDGLYETGPGSPRMRNTTVTTEYLPYSLSLNPASGTVPKNTNQTLTINGTIQSSALQGAYAGSYADTVVISIAP